MEIRMDLEQLADDISEEDQKTLSILWMAYQVLRGAL